jgi:hypothetical protein
LTGWGRRGQISYDWKHLVYEDYDTWLLGSKTGIFADSHLTDSPDVLFVQTGLHSCFHGLPPEASKPSPAFIDEELKNVDRLLSSLSAAVSRANALNRWPIVIIMTSGRIFRHSISDDVAAQLHNCTSVFNKRIVAQARKYKFAVFDREEIEHRILYPYEHDKVDRVLAPMIHEPFPVPQVISTALLSFLSCLVDSGYGTRQEQP